MICLNGKIVEEEPIVDVVDVVDNAPTDSQRIEALEAAVGELAVMVATKEADGNA